VSLFKFGSILYKGAIFHYRDTEEKKLYLTFDDGPTEHLTRWILKLLQAYHAKATFFCLGKNADRFPEQYQEIIDNGHIVGNHTQNHKKGWCTNNQAYFRDITNAQKLLKSPYFRPPHGKIKKSQFNHLKQSYNIVFWDVLTKDYRQDYEPAQIYKRIIRKTRKGSVLVFHDSLQAEANLKQVLPDILNYYNNQGYTFCSLPPG
jgi:peptidoglycan/xylan/chitin deacetylase (PgdA/CDA1 family)